MIEFKNIAFISVVLWMSWMSMQAQDALNVRQYSPRQLKALEKNAEHAGDIYASVDLLEPYCRMRPKDAALNFLLGEMYLASRDYPNAEAQFDKVLNLAADIYPQAIYFKAVAEKSQGKYDEAKELFTKFQRKLRYTKIPNVTNATLKDEIAGCEMSASMIVKQLKVSVERLNQTINGRHVELSPIEKSESEMLYASLKTDSIYFRRDDTIPLPVRQFYLAKRDGSDWSGGMPFDSTINIPGVETGNGAFSRDGKRFFFTRSIRNIQGRIKSEIYVANYGEKGWEQPKKLGNGINDPFFTATQPAIGFTAKSNTEVLYFVSDRPGGRGGMDIWYAMYDPHRKDFLLPHNAGEKINTPGDEMCPFYDGLTRTLYFSSNSHPGLGGFDIFRSSGELRKWTDPENIGVPFNSSYDDLYFSINKNRQAGFLVSNRPGANSFRGATCCDDIYQYRWQEFIKVDVAGKVFPADAAKLGKNLDYAQLLAMKDSIKPLANARLVLYVIEKKTKEKILIGRDTTKADGSYHFDLLPDRDYKFEMEGFQYFNEQVSISTDGVNFTYTIEMPPIYVNILSDKPIVLKNVYYDVGKSDLSAIAKKAIDSTLVELMQKATDIVVEVGSHTDSIGNGLLNKKLSQDRADNVIRYLVNKGIEKKRLVAKGYGADKPVAPNFKLNHTDNPEGREKNRRTEFRVIGTLSSQKEGLESEDTP